MLLRNHTRMLWAAQVFGFIVSHKRLNLIEALSEDDRTINSHKKSAHGCI